MARTYSAVVTATGDNIAFQIGVSNTGTVFTRMGFRQLPIFNKELSQDEVNDVLRAMFLA